MSNISLNETFKGNAKADIITMLVLLLLFKFYKDIACLFLPFALIDFEQVFYLF